MKYLFNIYSLFHASASSFLNKSLRIFITLMIGSMLLSACHTTNVITRNIDSDFVGNSNGFTKKLVKGGNFWITTYQRISNKHLPYVFYIEGDGLAFMGRYSISDNPTPVRPMLLKLAALDNRPNVVYIARPCQFTPMNLNPNCNQSYWTNLRMSDEVVTSLDKVINVTNNELPFSLVGYSGGGGIAVLIAARNKLVKDIITISGNLDHIGFNKYHNTTPMLGSLNPIDYATKIRNIPQLHISGGKDTTVPPFIADKFVQASGSTCVHQHIFDVAQHTKGWEATWDYILNMPLTCYKN